MRTDNDLRGAFALLEEAADAYRAPAAAPVRTLNRRRVPVLAAASVVAVVAAVAIPTMLARTNEPAAPPIPAASPIATSTVGTAAFTFAAALPAPSTDAPPVLRLGFAMAPVVGYSFTVGQITRTYQAAQFAGSAGSGTVYLFYRDEFDASSLDRSHPVTIAGQTGFVASVHDPAGQFSDAVPALVWPYAERGWAVALGSWGATGKAAGTADLGTVDGTAAHAPAVAAAVHPADTALSAPVRVSGVAGLTVREFGVDGANGGLTLAADDGAWTLGWSVGSTVDVDTKPSGSSIMIGGRQWIVLHDGGGQVTSVGFGAPDFGLTITWVPSDAAAAARPLDLARLEAFAAHVTLAAAPGTVSTWFDASTVLS